MSTSAPRAWRSQPISTLASSASRVKVVQWGRVVGYRAQPVGEAAPESLLDTRHHRCGPGRVWMVRAKRPGLGGEHVLQHAVPGRDVSAFHDQKFREFVAGRQYMRVVGVDVLFVVGDQVGDFADRLVPRP